MTLRAKLAHVVCGRRIPSPTEPARRRRKDSPPTTIAYGLIWLAAIVLISSCGAGASLVSAQPPDLPDLPADLSPPKFDLGSSAEAQAEQAKTQDQPTVVRTPKPVDFDRLVANLSLLALSLYIGLTIGSNVRIGFHPQFLAGATAIAGVTIVGALLTGTKIAAGTSKANPILLGALGCAAILLAMTCASGAFLLTRRFLGEQKRGESVAAGMFGALVAVAVMLLLIFLAPSHAWVADLAFLMAALLLILAADGLARPITSASGILRLGQGLSLAFFVAFIASARLAPIAQPIAALIGLGLGHWLAKKAAASQSLYRPALFTALGGLATAIVGGAALLEESEPSFAFVIAAALAGAFGGVAFSGGLVAYFKLKNQQDPAHPIPSGATGLRLWPIALLLVVALGVWLVQLTRYADVFYYGAMYAWLSLAAAACGALIVLPKNGPSLSVYTPMMIAAAAFAVAATGFALDNKAIIIVGAVIGAATLVLSRRLVNEIAVESRA